jgi:hypothetical protein
VLGDSADVPRDIEALASKLDTVVPVLGEPTYCYLSGAHLFKNPGVFVVPGAAGVIHANPPGSVINGNTFVVPSDGRYRLLLWVRYDNAAIGHQAAIRFTVNGAVQDQTGTARVWNGVNAGYPTATGFVEAALVAGNQITPQVMHDENATRGGGWRMIVEKIGV